MSYSKALIVDDSKIARVTLKKKLEQRGLEAVVAEDANQALKLLKTETVDVVFMDHMMPGMDGFEATAQIKADAATAHLPVIMCSGKENEDYLEQARAIGASNILAKPADNESLDAVFAELEHSQLTAATPPVSSAAAAPSSPVVADAAAEQAMRQLLSPLAAQVEALGERLNHLHTDIEAQVTASGRAIQAIEEKQSAEEPASGEALRAELTCLMDERLSTLYLPAAEDMQSQLKESLRADLTSHIDTKMQSELSESIEALRSSLTAQMNAQDRRNDMENSMTQQLDALKNELHTAHQESAAQAPDLEAWKLALRDELLTELAYSEATPAPQRSLLPLTLLTLASSMAAAAAVALHFIL